MKYIYNTLSLPPLGRERLQSLDAAAERLWVKVKALKADGLPLSEEGKHWLAEFQRDPDDAMRKNLHLVAWALYPQPTTKDVVFIDHGGAAGLVSCFAREAGIPVVIYHDIWEPWCKDARVLAEHLGCLADEYVCGELVDVSKALESKRDFWCTLVSVNVIEHVYDMDEFLEVAAGLSRKTVTLVLSTSANPMNPLVRRRHEEHHREWEFQDGPHTGFVLTANVKAFYKVRVEIIRSLAPALSEAEQAKLAAATRGLRRDDIEKCVNQYQTTGKISATPEHHTNTCDPMSGAWEERLLNVEAVTGKLKQLGFKVDITGGYYSGRASSPAVRMAKKSAARMMNYAISLLGKNGARIAPCFTFHATRG